MSAEDIEAEASISLDPRKFQKGSEVIKKELDEISGTARDSGNRVDDSFDKMGDSAKQSGDKIEDFADKTEDAMDKTVSSTKDAEGGMTTLAVSVLGLGQAIGGVTDAVFSFEEKLVALEKSMFGVEETARDVTRAIEDYNIALAEGNLSTLEYARGLEDIQFLNKKLAIEQKEVKAEQQALNGEFANFGLNIAQTVIFGITTITSLKTLLIAKQTAAAATAHAEAGAITNSTRAMATAVPVQAGYTAGTGAAATGHVGLTGSIAASTAGIRAFTAAMLASPLAPFAIAAIAAGTAFTIYETNAFGARDAMEDLSGNERGSFPTLTGTINEMWGATEELNETFGHTGLTIEEIQQLAEQTGQTFEQVAEQLEATRTATGEFNVESAKVPEILDATNEQFKQFGSNLQGVRTEFGNTSNAIQSFHEQLQGVGVKDLENRIESLKLSINSVDFDPMSAEFKLAKSAILPEIEDIAEGLELAFGEERTDEFLSNMERLGVLVSDDMDKIKESIRGVNKEIDETKKNYNDAKRLLELDELGLILEKNTNLAIIRQLITQAEEQFDIGNIDGVRFLEEQIRRLGNQPSRSGQIRSLQDQLKDFAAKSSNLRTVIRGGRPFTTTIGALTHALSVESAGGSFGGALGSTSVAHGGNRSAGRRARDRNPWGRLDKLGLRLRLEWQGFLANWKIPLGGEMIPASQLASLAGVNIPMPSTGATFGTNAGLSSDERRKIITDQFNREKTDFISAFGTRTGDLQFLLDFAPEKFDTIEEAVKVAFSGAEGRFATTNTLRKENPRMDKIVKDVIDEINEGSETLGFDTTEEEESMKSIMAQRDKLLQQIEQARNDPRGVASVFIDSGGSFRFTDLQRSLQTLDKIIRRGIADQEALEAFKKSQTDFRGMVRFNERIGRTGTTESIVDEVDRFENLNPLDFLNEEVSVTGSFVKVEPIESAPVMFNPGEQSNGRRGGILLTTREKLHSQLN